MSGGLWGEILRIDLSKCTIADEVIPEEWLRKFLWMASIQGYYNLKKGDDKT